MSMLSLASCSAALAVVAAISSGAIDDLLPGGRWNPYGWGNVTKSYTFIRVMAYVAALVLAFGLVALASSL